MLPCFLFFTSFNFDKEIFPFDINIELDLDRVLVIHFPKLRKIFPLDSYISVFIFLIRLGYRTRFRKPLSVIVHFFYKEIFLFVIDIELDLDKELSTSLSKLPT